MGQNTWRKAFVVGLTGVALSFLPLVCVVTAAAQSDTQEKGAVESREAILVDNALATFKALLKRPRFVSALTHAKGVVIFPDLLKTDNAGGDKSGSGVIIKRNENDSWSYPAFVQIAGGRFSPHIGVSVSQAVLVLKTEGTLEALLDGDTELGDSLSVGIGPAAIDAGTEKSFDVLTFTLFNQQYAGLTLEGSTIVNVQEFNDAYYGGSATPREIVLRDRLANEHAQRFRDALALAMGAI